MTIPTWAWAALAGLVVGAGGTHYRDHAQQAQEAARDQATIAALRTSVADLTGRVGKLDTVYRVDSLWRIKMVTYRDTVYAAARIDTFRVSVPVEVVRTVLAADSSALHACTQTIGTCEQRTAALRSIIHADSTGLSALSRELARAKARNRFGCTVGPGAAVIDQTVKVAYVAATCGFRFF